MTLAERIDALGGDERRVLEFIVGRLEMGRQLYGKLDVGDGRDWLHEASAEAADLLVYLACKAVKR